MATRQKLENRIYEPEHWEEVPCPVCKSTSSRIYERFGDRYQYTYNLCKDCSMVYASPRPRYDKQFIYDAYEFYAEDFDHFSSDLNTPGVKAQLALGRQELLDFLPYCKSRGSFLDVGCETGRFLATAREYFDRVTGLEVSKSMAEFAARNLSIEVYTDLFENLDNNLEFDCIRMSHVIEHIPDPHLWLEKARSLLSEGGVLVINVPNIFSLSKQVKLLLRKWNIRPNRWEPWRTPDHLFEPTAKSMLKLLKMHGFKVMSHYTYSNRNPASHGLLSGLMHRFLKKGNNLRFITVT